VQRQHVAFIVALSLDDISEDGAPPAPGAVDDDVGRVGDERSVVCVELARLVGGTVDLILECGGLPFGGYGPHLVGVNADQSLLSGRGLNGPIRAERIRMLISTLLS